MQPTKLELLRDQVHALQRVAREPHEQANGDLTGILAQLQQSLAGLKVANGTRSHTSLAGSSADSPVRRRPGRVRALAERSPVPVRAMGKGTHCRWANRAWSQFTGRSPDLALGDGWLLDVHPEDRARCARSVDDPDEVADFGWIEYRLRRAGGDFARVLELRTPRVSSLGRSAGHLASVLDHSRQHGAGVHLELVYACERILAHGVTLEDAAAPILELLCRELDWDVGELWSAGGERCLQRWSSGTVDVETPAEEWEPTHGADRPHAHDRPLWVTDIAVDPAFARAPEAQRFALHGMLRAPVPRSDGGQAGLRLYAYDARPRDEAVLTLVACVAARLGHAPDERRAGQASNADELRKAAILDALPDAVITVDPAGRVVESNPAAEALLGLRSSEAQGNTFIDRIVPRKGRKRVLERWLRVLASPERGLMGARFDTLAIRADGSLFPAQFAMAQIAHGKPPYVTICVWDVSERKQAEDAVAHYRARVQSLMSDLVMAEERERRRLAVDLHDGLSQTFALVQIKLSALRDADGGELDQALGEIQELMGDANRDARSIGFELCPLVLHDLGLEPALEWLAESIHERYGIDVELEHDGLPTPADEATHVILFRAIRELVINAAKHAGVKSVQVRVERSGKSLRVAVKDAGIGMEPGAALSAGFGLLSIRERMAHVGGSMRIESIKGKGTTVRLSAPLRQDESPDSMAENQ